VPRKPVDLGQGIALGLGIAGVDTRTTTRFMVVMLVSK
jgi:hypothetical protein